MFLPIQDLTQSNHSFLLKVSFLRTFTTPVPMTLLSENYLSTISLIRPSLNAVYIHFLTEGRYHLFRANMTFVSS